MATTVTEWHGDGFTLRPQQRQLLLDGKPAKLGARAFDMLSMLVERRGHTVSKAELLARVWAGRVVAENNLEVHIWALRKLLGTNAIATIPGRGYRFTLAPGLDGGAESDFSELPAGRSSPLRSNLPQRLIALIGREEDVEAVGRLLIEHPLVTLTGAGGIGKTLLAQHVLGVQQRSRAHGVCWVDLAPLPREEAVVDTVISAMGLSLRGSDPLQSLCDAIAPLSLLLALDNAEAHVAEVARVAAALVSAAPGVALLVTSQVPLRLSSERVYRLGPLATPPHDVPAAEALRYGAVALFADRAHALQQRFRFEEASTDDARAACAIVRALDGNPLAIELAAARVGLLGVRRVAAALGERLQLLTVARRDAPGRHHSLRAALEWSHGLLSAAEQCVFRRLAVFAGSFSLDLALQTLADDQELDRWAVLDALDGLVERSLVAIPAEGIERYRLLESPGALARECLAASPETERMHARHARAAQLHFVRIHADSLDGRAPQDELIDLLEADLDNGRAAFAWALDHDSQLAVSLARPLAFGLSSLRYAEIEATYTAALKQLHLCDDARDRLACLLGASICFGSRNADRALPFTRQAVTLARELRDDRSLARALGRFASLRSKQSADEHRAALAEMLAIVRPQWPAIAHMHAAEAECTWAYHDGDLDRVEVALRRWLSSAEAAGSRSNVEATRLNLADLALARGNPREAVRLGAEMERHWQGSRHQRGLAMARMNLTAALLACDDPAAARAVAERGWPMAAAWRLQAFWGVSLALLAGLENRPRAAARLLGYADERLRGIGERHEPNEARTRLRVQALLDSHLSAESIASLAREGVALTDAQVGALAFAGSELAE